MKTKQNGFTLIEIMIVVAIIGILAKIAIPAYGEYVKKGKLAEATSTLADVRVKMEQCFQDNRDYTNAACTALCTPAGKKYFTYSCDAASATATTYKLKADGISSENMGSYHLTVDQANTKTGW